MKSHIPWYNRKVTVVLLVFIFFPVGLYGLWKSERFSKKERVVWCMALAFAVLIGSFQQPPPPSSQAVKKTQPSNQTPAATKAEKIIIDVAGNNPTHTKTEDRKSVV